MIIKDSMVIIHLAKITLLEKSCDYFNKIIIPKLVYKEVMAGKGKYPEVLIISALIKHKKIIVENITNKNLIKKANDFGIQRGESEVVALYWQEKADLIATDDDNVRKKATLLDLRIIGTPSIILKLYKKGKINKNKLKQSILELKKIGWFNTVIFDKILMEVKND